MKTLREISCNAVLSEAQIRKIEDAILKRGRFTQTAVRAELDAFCDGLTMSAEYFATTPVETIAKHLEALMAAEVMAAFKGEKVVKVDFST